MDTGLHPQTPGVTPASDSPLPWALQQGKLIFIYLIWGWELRLKCMSPEEPPKIASGALS